MPRDLESLIVPRLGSVVATGEVFEPYRLLDPGGGVVGPDLHRSMGISGFGWRLCW